MPSPKLRLKRAEKLEETPEVLYQEAAAALRSGPVEEEVVVAPNAAEAVNESIRAFERKEGEIRAFMQANDKVFDSFGQLVTEYNAAISNARNAIANHPGPLDGINLGAFGRKKAPESVSYAVERMPKHILTMPGVLAVNAGMVESLIAANVVRAEEVAPAKTTTTGTAAVIKPAEITIKLPVRK